jgi:hypothetical protein
MKRAIFGLVLASLIGAQVGRPSPAAATEVGKARPLGFGFALGVPTSLVGKYFLNASNAVDLGLSFGRLGRRCASDGTPYSCDGIGSFGIFGDYLWHDTLARGTAQLDWHFGPGARLWVGNDDRGDNVALAARLPIGLDLTFDKPDFLELFIDIAPALYVVPAAWLEIEAFMGVRFYF